MTQLVNGTDVPLVVDLDGTLIRCDLLQESTLQLLRGGPYLALALPWWLRAGKASLKRRIADRVSLDVTSLPYNDQFVDWIRVEHARGRRIVLCTASDQTYAQGVAAHLGLFDEVIASDGQTNMSARNKASMLTQRYGERGFDYAGNSSDDLHVWQKARRAILVDATASVRSQAHDRFTVEREFERPTAGLRAWLRAIRLHQWLKNLLVFVPLAGAHRIFDLELLAEAGVAFLALGLCASFVYIVNDLMDLESDRRHPRKRARPFAAGQLSPLAGMAIGTALLVGAFGLAVTVNSVFVGWLIAYLVVTIAYTLVLKQVALLDCLALGALYTLRIVAGWSAIQLPASFWLLVFSLFFFLSLAFLKRYSELLLMRQHGRDDAHGRGYTTPDASLIQTMGVASGFAAVMLMALYINGDTVLRLYSHPQALWLTIPILLYWISRMWMLAHRSIMDDDPVLFAVRDSTSWLCGLLFAAVMWAAT